MPASDTQFKKGNKASVGHSKMPKSFIEECKKLCEDFEAIGNPFVVLRTLCTGYKGVQPPVRLAAAVKLIEYGVGRPKETLEIQNKNPFSELDDNTLVLATERLLLAMKGRGGSPEPAQAIFEQGAVDAKV